MDIELTIEINNALVSLPCIKDNSNRIVSSRIGGRYLQNLGLGSIAQKEKQYEKYVIFHADKYIIIGS